MPPGTPNIFKPELGRNLSRLFVPERGGFETPQVLSGIVSLTHDFPGTLPYLSVSLFDNVGAVDVTLIQTALTPPDGFIWLVDECTMLANNEPAARTMRLFINFPTSLGTVSLTVARVDFAAGGSMSLPFPVGRRFIMPPQSTLNLSISALTAGGNLRNTFSYLQLPAGQFAPKG